MRTPFYLPIFIVCISLTSCSTLINNLPGVYSIDVQQGNIVDQDMIDQLRPNMTKRQVLYIMGSSMLVDVFHQKRWDYLYSVQPGGESRRQKRLSLFFDDDILIGVQGDFRPSSLPVIIKSNDTTVDVPKRDLDKTLWGKMKKLWSDDAPRAPEELNDEDSVSEPDDETTEKKSEEESKDVLNEVETVNEEIENISPEFNIPDAEVNVDNTTTEKQSTEILIEPLEEEKPQELEEIHD